jgi:DNA-binding NarL/FixJ family response regulator
LIRDAKMKLVRVLVADDHEVVREGLRALIERQSGLEVCGLAATGREAVDLARKTRPDVVVLDMAMPDLDGLEMIRQIRKAVPNAEVVVFSAHPSEDVIEDVFDAGAKSYIEKTEASQDLVAAIRAVAERRPFFTSKVAESLLAKFLGPGVKKQADRARLKLTARERHQTVVRFGRELDFSAIVLRCIGYALRSDQIRTTILSSPRKFRSPGNGGEDVFHRGVLSL